MISLPQRKDASDPILVMKTAAHREETTETTGTDVRTEEMSAETIAEMIAETTEEMSQETVMSEPNPKTKRTISPIADRPHPVPCGQSI